VTPNPVWTKDMVREIQRKAETGAYVVRAYGAARMGIATNTGEGGMLPSE